MPTTFELSGGTKKSYHGMSRACVLENRVDLTGVTTASTDIIESLNIPAGFYVTAVAVKVVTATGRTSTATVGDGAGANSWDASTNLNATAETYTISIPGTDAYATTGKLYTTADTIDLVAGHNFSGGVYDVFAVGFDLNSTARG